MTEGHAEVLTRYLLAIAPNAPAIGGVMACLLNIRRTQVDGGDMTDPQHRLLSAVRDALEDVPPETLDGIQCAWETRLS